MIEHLSEHAQQVNPDIVGRLVAYGGGGTGLVITKAAETVEQASVYDWGYWMFGVAILGRLIFDVVKYIRGTERK